MPKVNKGKSVLKPTTSDELAQSCSQSVAYQGHTLDGRTPRENMEKVVSLENIAQAGNLNVSHQGDIKDAGIGVFGTQVFSGNVTIGHTYNYATQSPEGGPSIGRSAASSKSLVQIAANTADTKAAVEAFPTLLQEKVDDIKESLVGQVRTGFAQHMQSHIESFLLLGVTQTVERSVKAALESHFEKTDSFGSMPSICEAKDGQISYIPQSRDVSRSITWKSRFARSLSRSAVSTTTYWIPLCTIIVRTTTTSNSSACQDSKLEALPIQTVNIEIRLNLGYFRKDILFTRRCRTYDPSFDMSLKTRNIVGWDAPIIAAVKNLDIELTRKLFQEGGASPFDYNPYRESLLVYCFRRFADDDSSRDYIAFRDMVFLLTDCSVEWVPEHVVSFSIRCYRIVKASKTQYQETIRQIFKKILSSPESSNALEFDGRWAGPYWDVEFSKSPAGQMLLQDYDSVGSDILGENGSFWENNRHILQDMDGQMLSALLVQREHLDYKIWNNSPLNVLPCEVCHQLLNLAKIWGKELYSSCLNRLVILIGHGWDPRRLAHPLCSSGHDYMYLPYCSISEHAKFTDTTDLWTKALTLSGWSDLDIMHLLDEDVYLGVPELLDGNMVYMTYDESWGDFIEGLRCGRYVDYDSKSTRALARTLSCNLVFNHCELKSKIDASIAAFNSRKIPGSWIEPEMSTLPPGYKEEMELEIADLLKEKRKAEEYRRRHPVETYFYQRYRYWKDDYEDYDGEEQVAT